MRITVEEIRDAIKNIFKDEKIFDISSVYEKIDDSNDLKLVIVFNKLFYKETIVMYTKLIFVTDKDKTHLTKNSFMYLYDVNCIYHNVDFEDVEDFKKKLKKIFKSEKFGENIKILSKFIESPAMLVNDWLAKNDVRNISVFGFTYEPKIKIIPCKSLFFNFNIDVNHSHKIDLIISKDKDKFKYEFKFVDNVVMVEKRNLKDMVETIADTLKNNIKN
jgi:hypothetical protein